MSRTKYYKLPAELISGAVTPRAAIVYAVLADRAGLSEKNPEFKDTQGTYIIFQRQELCDLLGIGKRTADYAMAELEDAGLISRKKQGLNLPVKIYIKGTVSAKNCVSRSAKSCASVSAKSCASGSAESCAYINTDSIQTDISTSSPSPSSSSSSLKKILDMIYTISSETGTPVTDDQALTVLTKVRKAGSTIGNLRGWIKTCIENTTLLPAPEELPTIYADYENTSVLDEIDD